jgi:hypothetical protein
MGLHAQVFGKGLSEHLRTNPEKAGKPFKHVQMVEGRMLLCANEPGEGGLVVPLGVLMGRTQDEEAAIRWLVREPELAVFPMLLASPDGAPAQDIGRVLSMRRGELLRRAFFRKMISRDKLHELSGSVPDFEMIHLGLPLDADSPEGRRLQIALTGLRMRQLGEARRRLDELGRKR